MAWTKADRVRELAQLVGIAVAEDEVSEVADRFDSLVGELEKLAAFDLASIEPVTLFADEANDGT
jgi:Asp-tRNA(Asn)/Glu-tRNA(Gln) amidotransferase C subunit